jgi:hypothetical protein
MAIPGGNQNFTPTPDVGIFLPPNDIAYNPLSQIIRGGLAVGNTSQGRDYQNWQVFYESGDIKIKPVTGNVEFTYPVPNATIVSGAFDQNMSPIIAWVDTSNSASIYFFGPSGYTTLTVNGVNSMRLGIDDIREFYSAASDIFFAYTKNNNLYYRIQRDNYTNEYLIGSAPGMTLRRMGPTNKNRFQFELL